MTVSLEQSKILSRMSMKKGTQYDIHKQMKK